MRIIGRTLVILAVFAALSGLMVLAVNASGSTTPDFEGAPPQFRAEGGDGTRLPEGREWSEHDEDGEGGGFRWMFGLVKNVVVITLLVTLIVWPRSIFRKRKRADITSASGGV